MYCMIVQHSCLLVCSLTPNYRQQQQNVYLLRRTFPLSLNYQRISCKHVCLMERKKSPTWVVQDNRKVFVYRQTVWRQVVSSLLDGLPNQLHSRHLVVMPLAVLLENIAGVYVTLALGAEVVVLPSRSIGLMGARDLNVEQFINCKTLPDINFGHPAALLEVICAGVEYFGLSAHQFEFIAVGGARLAAAEQRYDGLSYRCWCGLSECAVVALNDISKQRPLRLCRQIASTCLDKLEVVNCLSVLL